MGGCSRKAQSQQSDNCSRTRGARDFGSRLGAVRVGVRSEDGAGRRCRWAGPCKGFKQLAAAASMTQRCCGPRAPFFFPEPPLGLTAAAHGAGGDDTPVGGPTRAPAGETRPSGAFHATRAPRDGPCARTRAQNSEPVCAAMCTARRTVVFGAHRRGSAPYLRC